MIIEHTKLWNFIDQYCFKLTWSVNEADKNTQLNKLSLADWKILIKIKFILKLFFIITNHLEKNAINRNCGVLWKVVLGNEYLIQFFEDQHTQLKNNIDIIYLKIFIALVLDKLKDYLDKTNRSAVWLAAIMFYSKHK